MRKEVVHVPVVFLCEGSLIILRDAACRVSRRRHNRLYQEGDKTRRHERSSPDQVEVEPCFPQKREAQLSIDHPSEQPSECKISNSVDPVASIPASGLAAGTM